VVHKSANTDHVIARIAENQHGVISTSQLESAGLSRRAIGKRVRAGRLHRLHRGVYALGHSNVSFEGRCMAATLALGDRAVVSHRSAAAVWGMLKPHSGPVELTVRGDSGRRKRSGIAMHRSHTLASRLTTRRHNVPVTRPARTLRDLRRTVPQPVYRAAVRKALDRRLIRSTGIPEAELTRSQLERDFLSLCRRHRFPQPEVNARLGRYEVDFLWRDRGLVVEADGFRYHGDRASFEADRARDAHLQSQGYRVLRFTWWQLQDSRADVVAVLRGFLGPIPLFG
jgi:very-short-patch-repair endonuclease